MGPEENIDSPTQKDDGNPGIEATLAKPHETQKGTSPPLQYLDDVENPLSPSVISHFDSLPPEIISIIANALNDDNESLKTLRKVNKICSSICTRLLFRDVNLLIDRESMAHLHCILGNPELRRVVTNISVNTAEYTDRNMDTFDWEDRDEELLKLFSHYLSRVGRFNNIKSIHLKFSKSCVGPPLRRHWWASQVPESAGFRMDTLQSLFKGLNDSSNTTPRFHRLTIENLQDWADDAFVKSEDFQAVMARVKHLEIQIATEDDETAPMMFIEKKELHDFFGIQLRRDWLAPCAVNLTRLKLYAGKVYWGCIPRCTLPHFPNLRCLSLGRMSFSHDDQLNWILSHADSLEELCLDDCPIVIGTAWFGTLDKDGYPVDTTKAISASVMSTRLYSSRWFTYFRAFRLHLRHLRALRCGFNDEDWENATAFSTSHTLEPRLWPERYRVFDTCWLERPPFTPEGETERAVYGGAWVDVPFYPDCTDEDLTELVKLREVINERTGVVDEELVVLKRMFC